MAVDPPAPIPAPLGGELAAQLRVAAQSLASLSGTLERAGELARQLESRLTEASPDEARTTRAFVAQVHDTDDELKDLVDRLVGAEQQVQRLMNLYVAAYQLHSTLDPDEVARVIAEVTINLIGSERFVVLVRREGGSEPHQPHQIAWREPSDGFAEGPFAGDVYAGGDPMVDATLADGTLRLEETPDSPVLGVVPLRFEEQTVGAIVLFSLLEHRPALRPEDRELFDLLSVQAASALFSARLFAAKQRRVGTLESMIRLARGEA